MTLLIIKIKGVFLDENLDKITELIIKKIEKRVLVFDDTIDYEIVNFDDTIDYEIVNVERGNN